MVFNKVVFPDPVSPATAIFHPFERTIRTSPSDTSKKLIGRKVALNSLLF